MEIITNKKELSYFRKSLLGLGLTEEPDTFYNNNIHITYTLADIPENKSRGSVTLSESGKYFPVTLS